MTVDSTNPSPEPDPLKEGRAEFARLQVKFRESKDKDVKSALQMRMDQLREQFGPEIEIKQPKVAAPSIKLPEKTEPPTEGELAEANRLIVRSRLEFSRGNQDLGRKLLDEAVAIAPGAPVVMEALGDYYFDRNQYNAAKAAYERARALDPASKSIESKFATAVLREFNAGSVEEQLRLGMNENLFLNPEDQRAGGLAITVLSAMLPGLGHIVAGQTATGVGILAGWVVCAGWLTLMRKDVAELLAFGKGGAGNPNLLVLVPIFLMFVIFIGTLKSIGAKREVAARKPVVHPRPPVDLPFE